MTTKPPAAEAEPGEFGVTLGFMSFAEMKAVLARFPPAVIEGIPPGAGLAGTAARWMSAFLTGSGASRGCLLCARPFAEEEPHEVVLAEDERSAFAAGLCRACARSTDKGERVAKVVAEDFAARDKTRH
jgi:hypothetical protein